MQRSHALHDTCKHNRAVTHSRNARAQVQTAVQLIMDTQPKGGAAGGGMSREETVDHIAEDLLGKACTASRLATPVPI